MNRIIPEYYRAYGKYVNSFRSFPLDVDGLKPVERRVLLTAYMVARDKLVKSARVEGTCMAKFHPHAGAYGTIVQMVNQGFLTGQGNFGFNLGVEPMGFAAQRYTECKMNPTTERMAFKYIKHVNWVESEMDDEPEYLPTMFPFCLMGNEFTQGIGFGFRTVIPCYKTVDLYRRLLWLLGKRKTKPTIKPITDCAIDSNNTVLEELLTTGKAKIDVHGVLGVNRGLCKATVQSWPPGKRFESILSKFKAELDINDVGFMDLSNDTVGTNIVFTVLKQRNRDKIFTKFVKKMEKVLKGTIPFEILLSSGNGGVIRASVDDMLMNTFNHFIKVNEKMLLHEIDRANELISEYNNIERVRPYISDEIRQNVTFDIDVVVDNIHASSVSANDEISKEIIKGVLSKYKISKLFTFHTDTTSLQGKVSDCQANLSNIQPFVLNQYDNLR